jgi:hypothetical protein
MNIESEKTTREAFVVYVPNKGFIKNKQRNFTPDFDKARLYGRKTDASNSLGMSGLKDEGFVIPVEMLLDPKLIFKAVLKGKS